MLSSYRVSQKALDTAGNMLIEIYCHSTFYIYYFNPLNAELNPICHLLALLGAHLILHISRIRVKCSSNR